MKFVSVCVSLCLLFGISLTVVTGPNSPDKNSRLRLMMAAANAKQEKLRDEYTKLESLVTRLRSDVETMEQLIVRNRESVNVLRHEMKLEMAEMKRALEQNENKSVKLQEKLTDLHRENVILKDTCSKYTTMHVEVQQNTNNTRRLWKAITKFDKRLNYISNSQQNMSEMFYGHMNKYGAEIQKSVDQREKCQSGDEIGPHLFNPGPDYPVVITVTFVTPFKKPPSIVYGLKTLDMGRKANVRMTAVITELTNTHFKLKIKTRADSELFGAKFSWMVCPT